MYKNVFYHYALEMFLIKMFSLKRFMFFSKTLNMTFQIFFKYFLNFVRFYLIIKKLFFIIIFKNKKINIFI